MVEFYDSITDLLFQGWNWTSVFLWCVQIHVRTVQSSIAAWIQLKRFCFQSQRTSFRMFGHHLSWRTLALNSVDSGCLPQSLMQTQILFQNKRADLIRCSSFIPDFFRTNALFIPDRVPVSLQKEEDTVAALEAELVLEAIEAGNPPPVDHTRTETWWRCPGRSQAGGPLRRRASSLPEPFSIRLEQHFSVKVCIIHQAHPE